ncbi:MAG: hypothetical protein II942_01335 [Alphaproteobacteria bacterium]|nr:hypothetical protein [Alphaproteobacteria bacterium]
MTKFYVKRFYPKGVTIIDEKIIEGDQRQAAENLLAESTRCNAISFEPKEGHGRMRALTYNPKYYRSTEVVTLDEAAKKPECADILRRINPKIHKALVKCGDKYTPLAGEDVVFDLQLKCIWPDESDKKAAPTLVSILRNSRGRK